MRNVHVILAILAAVFAAATAGAGEGKILYVYTWEDYFAPGVIESFEKKNGCRVEFEYYDSNETMIETLTGGGGYDILTPTPNSAVSLREMGAIADIDHSLLPNLDNLDKNSPCLAADPDMAYSVPYTVSVTGVGYNRKLAPEDAIGSWNVFADGRMGKRMAMLNDMRETIGAGLKFLGFSLNSINKDEVAAAGAVVRKWKRNLAVFDVDSAKRDLGNGKFAAIQAYSGDAANIMRDNPDLDFFIPREGAALNADMLTISADSENPELAHAFINHILDADAALDNMLYIRYYMPNLAALEKMNPDDKKSISFAMSPGVAEKCEMVLNLGAKRDIYDQVWEEILIGD